MESDTLLICLCVLLPSLIYLESSLTKKLRSRSSLLRIQGDFGNLGDGKDNVKSGTALKESIEETSVIIKLNEELRNDQETFDNESRILSDDSNQHIINDRDTDIIMDQELVLEKYMASIAIILSEMSITIDLLEEFRAEVEHMNINATFSDLLRFLVARKGSITAAKQMLEDSCRWRVEHFPLKYSMIEGPLNTGCIFFYGNTRDGSPVFYFRNALYDKNAGTPLQYTLAIAYLIDYKMRRSIAQSAVVFVQTNHVEGAINGPADFSFIKPFVKTFSDNYPERLKQLIMYPFPWYGRASWSVVKMFIDKRTQSKVQLLPAQSGDVDNKLPNEVYELISPDEIPLACGGTCTQPIVNVLCQLGNEEDDFYLE